MADPLGTRVEFWKDHAWYDATAAHEVSQSQTITIERGRGDESGIGEPQPTTCQLSFRNRSGAYSPHNPASPLYRRLRRNVPLRLHTDQAGALTDQFNRSATNSWAGTGALTWSLSGGTVPDDYDINGTKALQTHPSANVLHYSTVDAGTTDARVRAVFNLSAGTLTGANASVWLLARMASTSSYYAAIISYTTAGGVSIQLAKRVGGVLTTLGSAVNAYAGYGGLFATYQFAAELSVEGDQLAARLWDETNYGELNGWHVQETDTSITAGTLTGLASRRETGNTNANLAVAYDQFTALPGTLRFYGEMASLTRREPAVGGPIYADTEPSGLLRRLTQGAKPLRSPLYRRVTAQSQLLAYWPMEDAQNSLTAASAVAGVADMDTVRTARFTTPVTGEPIPPPGAPAFAQGVGPTGSAPVASLTQGGTLYGVVPATTQSSWQIEFVARYPVGNDSGFGDESMAWETSGTYKFWAISVADDDIRVLAYTAAGAGATGFAIDTDFDPYDGQAHHYSVWAIPSGSTVYAELYIDGVLSAVMDNGSGSAIGGTPGHITKAWVNYAESSDEKSLPSAIGHVAVFAPALAQSVTEANAEAAFGYPGETAGYRMARLCSEEGVPFEMWKDTDTDDTITMGPQPTGVTLYEHLAECERTDAGLLYETRNALGLGYRSSNSMCNQTAALALDYDQLTAPFLPTADDKLTRNDVIAKSATLGEQNAVQESGPMNVNEPFDDNDGVGRYNTQIDVNPATVALLLDCAGWRVNLGTVDEPRYPKLTVDLLANPSLDLAVSRIREGDLITVTGAPDCPDTVRLLVFGYLEVIGNERRAVTFNCVPASPYDVPVLEVSGYDRVDSDGSEVSTAFVAGVGTSLQVSTPNDDWGALNVPFDVVAGGVRLTVTAVGAAGSIQTLTVNATPVNGVTKTIPVGEPVYVYESTSLALA